MATKSQSALSSPGVVLISFKPPGWHLLGRRGQPEGSGAQVTKISKSVKRSILVSGFSGKWSLTEKASGGSQCWAQTIHTQLRLHLALRLHKRCPGSGDGNPSFISGKSGFISTPPSPALWTQWRWRRGLWPPALLKISQQLFKSSRGESTPQEGFSYEMKINPLTWQNKMVDQ